MSLLGAHGIANVNTNYSIPKRIASVYFPNIQEVGTTNIVDYCEFNGDRYYVTSNYIGKINSQEHFSLYPKFAIVQQSNQGYVALLSVDDEYMFVLRHQQGTLYMVDRNDDVIPAVMSNFSSAYVTPPNIIDNILYWNRSNGTSRGDAIVMFPYANLGVQYSPPAKILNTPVHSGGDLNSLIKFDGDYYVSLNNVSTIVKFTELTPNSPNVFINTTLNLNYTNEYSNVTKLVTDNENIIFSFLSNAVRNQSTFAVYDRNNWIVKNYPDNHRVIWLSENTYYPQEISETPFVLLQHNSTNQYSFYKWNSKKLDWDYFSSLPLLDEIHTGMTSLSINRITKWFGRKIYLLGSCVVSGITKGIILEMVK